MDDEDELKRLLGGLELPDVEGDGAASEVPPTLDDLDTLGDWE